MERGAWRVAVHGAARNRTPLSSQAQHRVSMSVLTPSASSLSLCAHVFPLCVRLYSCPANGFTYEASSLL